jgi:hypothetical protein
MKILLLVISSSKIFSSLTHIYSCIFRMN